MDSNRSTRIAVAFARETHHSPTARLCTACIEVLEVSGAGITIMGPRNSGPVCVSNRRMASLEDLQFTLGEGPCQDAFRSGRPVLAPRLDGAAARWPAFVAAAEACGVGAVFAYPMAAGRARVGVLTLYQDTVGDLTDTQQHDSVAVAEVLAETVLSMQDTVTDGSLAPELDGTVVYRAQIYQASGMVAVQEQITADEALLRMRAFSFASGRQLSVVAEDIVGRRLRIGDPS